MSFCLMVYWSAIDLLITCMESSNSSLDSSRSFCNDDNNIDNNSYVRLFGITAYQLLMVI